MSNASSERIVMTDEQQEPDEELHEQQTSDVPPQWITIRECARRAGIPFRTMYNWVESGSWPVRVVSMGENRQRVRLDEFQRWLDSLNADHGE